MSILQRAGQAIGTAIGLTGAVSDARRSTYDVVNSERSNTQDWRVRLALAPEANYLYKAPGFGPLSSKGILEPLYDTDGVIFPYTPQITLSYAANYDATEPTHSNYKIYQYKNSAVDQISIVCDFTAQDTREADYLLATIHFFRSVTKMFYGQDGNPRAGTPPPLCYLYGLGEFQFDKHPIVISSFTYSLPNNVDYIRARIGQGSTGDVRQIQEPSDANAVSRFGTAIRNISNSLSSVRLGGSLLPGGIAPPPVFTPLNPTAQEATYVPTKIQIQLTAYPVVSRNDISNNFSLAEYGRGLELYGGSRRNGGGIW